MTIGPFTPEMDWEEMQPKIKSRDIGEELSRNSHLSHLEGGDLAVVADNQAGQLQVPDRLERCDGAHDLLGS